MYDYIQMSLTVLQAVTILAAMASGKNSWQLKFCQLSQIGDLRIKSRETHLKNYQ